AGRVAFLANVAGDAFEEGIWVEDAAHQLHEVVRTGMQIQLAPGDVRTLTDIDWPDNRFRDFSPLLPYNAAGQIVFQATFGSFNVLLLYNPLLPGDYNGNGTVDTADYIVWRDSIGQSGMGLAADGDGNTMIDGNDYAIWKSHFGQTS